MNDEAKFDQAVGLIYDAVLAPDQLPLALAHMTEWLQGDTCHLVGWKGGCGEPLLSVSTGLDEGIGQDYAAYYAAIDPRRQLALDRYAPGELLLCHEHFDKRFVSRSEFFQDYLLPIGIHHMLGTTLVHDSQHLVQIAFQRHVNHVHFSQREITLAHRLSPHLQRACQLLIRNQQSQDQSVFNQAVVDNSPFAMLALSIDGEVLHANSLGERLLRSGHWMRQVGTRLCARDVNRRTELLAALRNVASNGRPVNMNLRASDSLGHCCLTLMRMPQSGNISIASSKAVVLCLITESHGNRIATARQLMELFGLSPAEARLVRGLVQGNCLDEYATHQGLKRTTVKSQLRNALLKMGFDNQRDLIRMVLRLPVVRE